VLEAWAQKHDLTVTWYTGEQFAGLAGSAASVGSAFGVAVDSFRSRSGEVFYSATRQAGVPEQLRPEVTGIGAINNYGRLVSQFVTHDYVPNGGLTPQGLLEAYDATPLSSTEQGAGETVVFLEGSPVEQSDLNAFTQKFGLPQISLQTVG
jgi:kumamolisin